MGTALDNKTIVHEWLHLWTHACMMFTGEDSHHLGD